MKILALSTSTPRGSVAVLDESAPHAAVVYTDLKGHAERIFTAIDAVLRQAGLERTAIEGLACDIGPGSFTGVRVGVASAKGIALGLGVPVVPVVSLEAMAAAAFAEGAAGEGDAVLSAIDAKKGELFLAGFVRAGSALRTICPPHLRPNDPASFELACEGRRVVVVWDLPCAVWVARLGEARLAAGLGEDAAAIEPLYVREPDANRLPASAAGG